MGSGSTYARLQKGRPSLPAPTRWAEQTPLPDEELPSEGPSSVALRLGDSNTVPGATGQQLGPSTGEPTAWTLHQLGGADSDAPSLLSGQRVRPGQCPEGTTVGHTVNAHGPHGPPFLQTAQVSILCGRWHQRLDFQAALSRGEPARGGCRPPYARSAHVGLAFPPEGEGAPLQARGRPGGPGLMAECRRSHTWPWPETSRGQLPPDGPGARAPLLTSQQRLQEALPLGAQHP